MKYLQSFKIFESKIIGHVKKFGYRIVKTEPTDNLVKYKDHRRLKVFYHKGLECMNFEKCGRKGEILTHGIDKKGNLHIDVCTKDFYPMTIDHILPKSKGGTFDLENLDPMCYKCNQNKGDYYDGHATSGKHAKSIKSIENKNRRNKRKHLKGNVKKSYEVEIGDVVYKKVTDEFLGKIVDIKPNPRHPNKVMSAQIEERDSKSLYPLKSLYKIINK